MLLRQEHPGRVVAIPQPSHAWVAGQLAAAWGNVTFARPAAYAEWCLAAAIHDLGWAAWERAPTCDPVTGWPHQFPQVSPLVHVDLWREGVARARLFGRYPALLVSRHADTIYSRHVDRSGMEARAASAVEIFLDEQHAVQRELAASLAADPLCRDAASPEAVEHARLALATLDELSLALCWGVREPQRLADVPTEVGRSTSLTLRPGPSADTVTLSPWPFGPERLSVRCDGRVLTVPSASDQDLRDRLSCAPAVTIESTLMPG